MLIRNSTSQNRAGAFFRTYQGSRTHEIAAFRGRVRLLPTLLAFVEAEKVYAVCCASALLGVLPKAAVRPAIR